MGRFAPPGYPKTCWVSSRSRLSSKICAPVYFIRCLSFLQGGLVLQHSAAVSAGHKMGIAAQPFAGGARLEGGQAGDAPGDLILTQADVQRAGDQVDFDQVAGA